MRKTSILILFTFVFVTIMSAFSLNINAYVESSLTRDECNSSTNRAGVSYSNLQVSIPDFSQSNWSTNCPDATVLSLTSTAASGSVTYDIKDAKRVKASYYMLGGSMAVDINWLNLYGKGVSWDASEVDRNIEPSARQPVLLDPVTDRLYMNEDGNWWMYVDSPHWKFVPHDNPDPLLPVVPVPPDPSRLVPYGLVFEYSLDGSSWQYATKKLDSFNYINDTSNPQFYETWAADLPEGVKKVRVSINERAHKCNQTGSDTFSDDSYPGRDQRVHIASVQIDQISGGTVTTTDNFSSLTPSYGIIYSGFERTQADFNSVWSGCPDSSVMDITANGPSGVATYDAVNAKTITGSIYLWGGSLAYNKNFNNQYGRGWDWGLPLNQRNTDVTTMQQILRDPVNDRLYFKIGSQWWIYIDAGTDGNYTFFPCGGNYTAPADPNRLVPYGISFEYTIDNTNWQTATRVPVSVASANNVSQPYFYETWKADLPAGVQKVRVSVDDRKTYTSYNGSTITDVSLNGERDWSIYLASVKIERQLDGIVKINDNLASLTPPAGGAYSGFERTNPDFNSVWSCCPDSSVLDITANGPEGTATYDAINAKNVTAGFYIWGGSLAYNRNYYNQYGRGWDWNLPLNQRNTDVSTMQQVLRDPVNDRLYLNIGSQWWIYIDAGIDGYYTFFPCAGNYTAPADPSRLVPYGISFEYSLDGINWQKAAKAPVSMACANNPSQPYFYETWKAELPAGVQKIRVSVDDRKTYTSYNGSIISDVSLNGARDWSVLLANVNIDNKPIQFPNVNTLTLPSVLGTGMVFQQGKSINVWGAAIAGSNVTVKMIKNSTGAVIYQKATKTSDDNSWSVSFDPLTASFDTYKIIVTSDRTITIDDILIGEVWVSSGQSNMEMNTQWIVGGPDLVANANNPYIRTFLEPLIPGGGLLSSNEPYWPQFDVPGARWGKGNVQADVSSSSGVAYSFALKLYEQLNTGGKQVPVAIINTAMGSTSIEAWMPRRSIDQQQEIKSYLESNGRYRSLANWNKAGDWNFNQMTALFNAKIAPLAGMNISGVIWYQGENNIGGYTDAQFYRKALGAMMSEWSNWFSDKDWSSLGKLPFIYAHPAPHNYGYAPEGEAYFYEGLSDAWYENREKCVEVPIYDISLVYVNPNWPWAGPIHPNDKVPVGQRMAKAALGFVYGVSGEYQVPVYSRMSIVNNKIVMQFEHVGTGLKVKDGDNKLRGFAICGSDRKFHNAEAVITSANTVEVSNPYVSSPVAATYAFTAMNMASNLFNSANLPAAPFRTGRTASTYYNPKDWRYCDDATLWIDYITSEAGGAGYRSAWKIAPISGTTNITTSIASDRFYEGKGSLKFIYTPGSGTGNLIGVGPVLGYPGIFNQFENFNSLSFDVYNPDARTKQLSGVKVKLSNGQVYTLVIYGQETGTATVPAYDGNWHNYKVDLDKVLDSSNNIVTGFKLQLGSITELQLTFQDASAGTMYVDNINVGS